MSLCNAFITLDNVASHGLFSFLELIITLVWLWEAHRVLFMYLFF